jgi:hypothetical protein
MVNSVYLASALSTVSSGKTVLFAYLRQIWHLNSTRTETEECSVFTTWYSEFNLKNSFLPPFFSQLLLMIDPVSCTAQQSVSAF